MLAFLRARNRAATVPEIEDQYTIADEARLPLHILADDARLSVGNAMLHVEADGEVRSLRPEEVSLVALHGGAQVSVPCLHLMARSGVPLVLLSRNGYFLGQITDLTGTYTATHRAQYATIGDRRRCLALARQTVSAKLATTARLARRRLGARDQVTRALRRGALQAGRARSAERLRGLEGAAAAAWFGAWGRMLGETDSLFTFDGRSRRPPRDATNALLSYLYAVLTGTITATSTACGLDPHVGYFHAQRPGRPALALDLVDPLRPAMVDTAVIAAIRHREFTTESFETQPDGSFRLSRDGRRRALDILERRLSTHLVHNGTEMSWRQAITRYCQDFAAALRQGTMPPDPPMARG